MPLYNYRCPINGEQVEVRHGMSETIATWGELCRRAGRDPGTTPADAPVERVVAGGILISKRPPAGGHTCGEGCSHGH
jgi:hypothetical protein